MKLEDVPGKSRSYSVAIQGELGSNSHIASLELLGELEPVNVVPCSLSAVVFERLLDGSVDAAVLPIENSLHGSVVEHYDLLLEHPVRIVREGLLRIRFHLMAKPHVDFSELRRVLSHPVALAQCRRFLGANRHIEAVPFYDTAGSVKYLMEADLKDTAGIAPELAATQYGAAILQRDLEDHPNNFTRFQVICRQEDLLPSQQLPESAEPNKMTLAFSVEHRPGTLVQALQLLARAGMDLTKIESRPVPGRPWEYVFYVEFRYSARRDADEALLDLRSNCSMVKELGRYRAV